MSRRLVDLVPAFQEQVEDLLAACEKRRAVMVPFFTLRDPWTQARLWRQSRTKKEIDLAIYDLLQNDAGFLSRVLDTVGPQFGKWATNALPGNSWHQWGQAVDCFALVHGRAEWNADHASYLIYHEEAKSLGLRTLNNDAVHVQELQQSSPLHNDWTWKEINIKMNELFGDRENGLFN